MSYVICIVTRFGCCVIRLAPKILGLVLGVLLLGCVSRERDAVVLEDTDTLAMKPTLYQPSFVLMGALESQDAYTVRAPYAGRIHRYLVNAYGAIDAHDVLLELALPALPVHAPNTFDVGDSSPSAGARAPLWTPPARAKYLLQSTQAGSITHYYAQVGDEVNAGAPLVRVEDTKSLGFVTWISAQNAKYLALGQGVNLVPLSGQGAPLNGQIAALTPKADGVLVSVHLINADAHLLHAKSLYGAHVEFGQMQVGTLVPKHALHGANLSGLKTPPHRPLMPLFAGIWTVDQAGILAFLRVQVVAYLPDQDQYLIDDIGQGKRIITAPLTADKVGKRLYLKRFWE